MRHLVLRRVLPAFILMSTITGSLLGKDVPVSLDQCPAPVQATVRQYAAYGTMEAIAMDEKKKTGGPTVYEAKFNFPDGKRIEVHISPEGKVLLVENKEPKTSDPQKK